jgi:hypothetical protein
MVSVLSIYSPRLVGVRSNDGPCAAQSNSMLDYQCTFNGAADTRLLIYHLFNHLYHD